MKKLLILSPIHNETKTLEVQVSKVIAWCKANLRKYDWTYAVIDNASTDYENPLSFPPRIKSEVNIRRESKLFCPDSRFTYFHLDKKGRGLALKWGWNKFKFDYSLYMDIDLATDLESILSALEELETGADLVVGSRWLKQSVVLERKLKRTILSYCYKTIVKLMTSSNISDFQCGFKAVRSDFIKKIIIKLKDEQWFFDTELVLTAEKSGYKVKDIPVRWRDDPDTKVKIFRDSWGMFRSLLKFVNSNSR